MNENQASAKNQGGMQPSCLGFIIKFAAMKRDRKGHSKRINSDSVNQGSLDNYFGMSRKVRTKKLPPVQVKASVGQLLGQVQWESVLESRFVQDLKNQFLRKVWTKQDQPWINLTIKKALATTDSRPSLPQFYLPSTALHSPCQANILPIKNWIKLFYDQRKKSGNASLDSSFFQDQEKDDAFIIKKQMGWSGQRLLVVRGKEGCGKAGTIGCAAESLGMKCFKYNHATDPISYIRQMRQNTHSQTLQKSNSKLSFFKSARETSIAGTERFKRKVLVLRDLCKMIRLEEKRSVLVRELRCFIEESKIPIIATVSEQNLNLSDLKYDLFEFRPLAEHSLLSFLLLVRKLQRNRSSLHSLLSALYAQNDLHTHSLCQALDQSFQTSFHDREVAEMGRILQLCQNNLVQVLKHIEYRLHQPLEQIIKAIQQQHLFLSYRFSKPVPFFPITFLKGSLTAHLLHLTQESSLDILQRLWREPRTNISQKLSIRDQQEQVEQQMLQSGSANFTIRTLKNSQERRQAIRKLGSAFKLQKGDSDVRLLESPMNKLYQLMIPLRHLLELSQRDESKYSTRQARPMRRVWERYLSTEEASLLTVTQEPSQEKTL